ncbi:hypothetical protein MNBD_GAMMA26-1433 [hydrothermal vent metagenome]|uniref:Gingipain domain-containing protein n=1 Tax=hydrothermal vent metagenome TaxID=652676 RepID=A0A3B1BR53_9ZZZZ
MKTVHTNALSCSGFLAICLVLALICFGSGNVQAAWVDVGITQSSDDAEEQSILNLTSSDLELVDEGATEQEVGVRFQNVTIPPGSTINSAYIDFVVDETDSGATNLIIEGEDEDDAVTFSTAANITGRTRTSASVTWNSVPAWGTVGTTQTTPNLASIVQEIVNRGGWFSGNSMAILFSGTGERTAESYNGVSASAPTLRVNYGPGVGTDISIQVSQSSDDAEEQFSMELGSSDLELVDDGGTQQQVGLRYQAVEIPQGATILEAYLTFDTDETNSGATNLTFHGQDADDTVTFSSSALISGRTKTSASADWNGVPAWNTVDELHQSPDLAAIVQEIVDRGGWVSGNSMVLMITGTGERTAESWNGEDGPVLSIRYDGTIAPIASDLCYTVADSGDTLVTVPLTGATAGDGTSVGNTGTTSIEAITYDSVNGNLYAADAGQLGRLNRTTGTFYPMNSTFGTGAGTIGGVPTNITFTDSDSLSFNPVTTEMYGIHVRGGNDVLFKINYYTGAHISGAFGAGIDYLEITGGPTATDGMAIDPTTNTTYLMDNDILYTLSLTTGVTTVVGPLIRTEGGTVPSDMEGLGFADNGVLYGTTGNNGASATDNRLWSIATGTADATIIDSDGNGIGVGSDYESVDCVFNTAASTLATIGDMLAYSEGSRVVVQWNTLSEQGTVGFHLERLDEGSGKYQRLNKKLLPGLLHSRYGGTYRYRDRKARVGNTYTYRLVEVEASGNTRTYGPYTLTVAEGAPVEYSSVQDGFERTVLRFKRPVVNFERAARPRPTLKQARIKANRMARSKAKRVARSKAKQKKRWRKGPAVKVQVREDGLYYLSAAALSDLFELSKVEISRRIKQNWLRLTNRGKRVATLAAPGNVGLYFYGQAIDSLYTQDNLYRLTFGKGLRMAKRNGRAPTPVTGQSFQAVVHAEVDQYAAVNLFEDPGADYWMWDYLMPGLGIDSKAFTVSSPGLAGAQGGKATLVVRLQGGSEAVVGLDHHALVSFNGVEVGAAQWDGLTAKEMTLELPLDLLNDGENTVEVAGVLGNGVPYSLIYINEFTLSYPRVYTTDHNHLEVHRAGHKVISIDGFNSELILAFDISNPSRPRLIKRPTIDGEDNNYRISFRANAGRYLALTHEAVAVPEDLVVDIPSRLKKRHRVDYLIITSSDLMAAAQELADYRQGQNLRTMVVDIEDIYDEFSFGLKNPVAIEAFLRYAYARYRPGPRYVVLAGEGSYDYKDHMGFGDGIIPALLTATPDGLFPSDNLYADVVGDDSVPEIAIGRLPVINAEELTAYLVKLQAYEAASGGLWESQAILAADAADKGGNFSSVNQMIGELFPPEYLIDRLDLDTMPLADARQQLLDGLNEGRAFVNFTGHGSIVGLGNNGLFTSSDVATLDNAERLPVLTALTCLAGHFGYPGFDSIAENLVIKPDGGAIAVWSPSGMSMNDRASIMGRGFYSAIFQDQGENLVLGDALLKAKINYAKDGIDPYLLNTFNLIGDPATIMK